MDSCVLDITDVKDTILEGQFVEIFNERNFEKNFLENNNLSVYELFTHFSSRMEKKYIYR